MYVVLWLIIGTLLGLGAAVIADRLVDGRASRIYFCAVLILPLSAPLLILSILLEGHVFDDLLGGRGWEGLFHRFVLLVIAGLATAVLRVSLKKARR